jgi:DNA-directed RNA polymerase specialized sigma24 family protein
MRRPRRTTIDPEAFGSGAIGAQTATYDQYFQKEGDTTLRIVVGHFVDRLPEPQKSAVEMCVMAGMTYEEAAAHISVDRGIVTHKKTVWRWAKQGVNMLGEMFQKAGWVGAINPKVPDYE